MVEAAPNLLPQVSTLFSKFLAISTYKNYSVVIKDFKLFYEQNGSQNSYKDFIATDVLHFVAYSMAKEKPFS